MKKLIALLITISFATLIACGPSAEEKAAAEKARQDSINAVMAQMVTDSMNAAQALIEKARQDSLIKVAHADSIAMEIAKKKSSAIKPKKEVNSKTDTRTQTTKEADKKVESGFDKFKKKK